MKTSRILIMAGLSLGLLSTACDDDALRRRIKLAPPSGCGVVSGTPCPTPPPPPAPEPPPSGPKECPKDPQWPC